MLFQFQQPKFLPTDPAACSKFAAPVSAHPALGVWLAGGGGRGKDTGWGGEDTGAWRGGGRTREPEGGGSGSARPRRCLSLHATLPPAESTEVPGALEGVAGGRGRRLGDHTVSPCPRPPRALGSAGCSHTPHVQPRTRGPLPLASLRPPPPAARRAAAALSRAHRHPQLHPGPFPARPHPATPSGAKHGGGQVRGAHEPGPGGRVRERGLTLPREIKAGSPLPGAPRAR